MIDLDYNATTPLDPEVAALMAHVATHVPGNAASIQHGVGSDAAQVVERARHQVGRVLDVSPNSIVWTSGATEGLHLADRFDALQPAQTLSEPLARQPAGVDSLWRTGTAGITAAQSRPGNRRLCPVSFTDIGRRFRICARPGTTGAGCTRHYSCASTCDASCSLHLALSGPCPAHYFLLKSLTG